LNFNANDGGHRRKASAKGDTERVAPREGSTRRTASGNRTQRASNVGDALKSAYQRTLDEDIPPEMLDLLGKLG
jgi:hypothetical protein